MKHTFIVAKERFYTDLDEFIKINDMKKKDAIGYSVYLLINQMIAKKMTISSFIDSVKILHKFDCVHDTEFVKTSVYLDEDILEMIYLLFAKMDGKISKNEILNYAIFNMLTSDEEVKDEYYSREFD